MKDEPLFVVRDNNTQDDEVFLLREYPEKKVYTYRDLALNPGTIASDSEVFFTFPFKLWQNQVWNDSVHGYKEIYGSRNFGSRIESFSDYLQEFLEHRFPGARFVNEPGSIYKERNKRLAKELVSSAGVPVAENIPPDLDSILETAENHPVYIKVNFGSMGKGITYVDKDKWTTNFGVKGKDIYNHFKEDWPEINITGNKDLLRRILEEDVIVEKAIKNYQTNGLKFDLRTGMLYSEPSYGIGRVTGDQSITNISQGGRALNLRQMTQYVPAEVMAEAYKMMVPAMQSLNMNYGGADFLFTGDSRDTMRPAFLEINGFPSENEYATTPGHDAINYDIFQVDLPNIGNDEQLGLYRVA